MPLQTQLPASSLSFGLVLFPSFVGFSSNKGPNFGNGFGIKIVLFILVFSGANGILKGASWSGSV